MNILSPDEEKDAKDEKSLEKLMKSTLPQFSNEADWEMSIFEISLIIDRVVWPHKDDLDIVEYMTNPAYTSHTDFPSTRSSLKEIQYHHFAPSCSRNQARQQNSMIGLMKAQSRSLHPHGE